jgi:predicted permease
MVAVRRLSQAVEAIVSRHAPEHWRESLIGDLTEELTRRRAAGKMHGLLWQLTSAITAASHLRAAERKALHPMSRVISITALGNECRQAFRALVRRPAFSAITILTLTLGIGAGTAVFSLSNWLILRPVPGVTHPDALVTVRLEMPSGGFYTMSMPEYRAIAAAPGLASLAAADDASFHVAMGTGGAIRVTGAVVTSNYFSVLEQSMSLGRAFGPDEDDPANASVAIVSHGFWQRNLGADPAVLGRRLTVNGHAFTVVGVAARGFRGPDRSGVADLWVPIASFRASLPSYPANLLTGKVGLFFTLVGRPVPGTSVAALTSQLEAIQASLSSAEGAPMWKYTNARFTAHPGLDVPAWQRDGLRQMFALLLGVAGMLLLLTTANVANLFFAHAHERADELATRQALGASRLRVLRQLVLEGLLLSLVGGALALAASAALGQWIDGMVIARNLPALSAVSLDWRVFLFALGLSVVVSVGAATVPAFMGSRVDLMATLKATGRGGIRGGRGLRRALTFVQVAVAVMLLSVGTLLVRSVMARYQVPLGYDADKVLAFSVDASVQGYSNERTIGYFRDSLSQLRALPGVTHAGLAYIEPFRMIGGGVGLTPIGRADAKEIVGDTNMVSDDFFPSLGVRFLSGRDFRPDEIFRPDTNGNGVLIVNEAMALALFGTRDVAGRQVTATYPAKRALTIVGVVTDIRTRDVSNAVVKPTAFEPYGQSFLSGWGAFHVRLSQPAPAVTPAVIDLMRRIDPELPVYDVELVSASLDRHLAEPRLLARTIETFAILATLVAALGLYGVLARAVEERRREFGIRAALGARPAVVAGLITREALVVSLAGGLAGAAGAVWLGGLIEARLFGVRPLDPVSLGLATALALAAGLLASVAPALRAARVDVVHELR